MTYHSFNDEMKKRFGSKVYKLSLDAGMTCPNRDGTCGVGGCIFCSEGGSGDFAEKRITSLDDQINRAKQRIENKVNTSNVRYIAYFQSYTNTYAPVEKLRTIYTEVISRDDICAVSIGTRPDCLPTEVLDLLSELNKIKPVWVELGLQTIHEKTAEWINRGYRLDTFEKAVKELNNRKIETIVHVILGFPNETKEEMLETIKYLSQKDIQGIKLQLLHILENTKLAEEYKLHPFPIMSMEEYVALLAECIKILPKEIVIHRLTGDGAKKDLIAPLWSADKKRVLNAIRNYT